MTVLNERISSLDISLFASIGSQTTDEDKKSLLLLQDCIRNSDEYVYLEIGSFRGGTIQLHYIDPKCKLIYSIDKREEFTPDVRGPLWNYSETTTESMLGNLTEAYPSIDINKIKTFDSGVYDIKPEEITESPNYCFIDAEHTNQAVFSDFKFCLSVSDPNAVIAFHDSGLIFEGIKLIKKYLTNNAVQYSGYKLGGSVYVILLNEANSSFADKLKPFLLDETVYFKTAKKKLLRTRLRIKYPRTFRVYRKCVRIWERILNEIGAVG